MKLTKLVSVCAIAVASSAALLGCGDGGSGRQVANIPAGEMPSGESWTGVYFHPVFGYLHMMEEGSNVIARWKRANGDAWGELSGTATGNVLHYQWKEHKIGLVGPAAESQGKGYFVYKRGKEEGIYELDGQFGLNQAETGSDWHCVKQQRMTPDLKSISGDTGGVAPPAAGKWD
jgi:hypothetical protein